MGGESKSGEPRASVSSVLVDGGENVRARTPIVGIAVYATDFDDLRVLLSHLPNDTGFAYIVVPHNSAARTGISVESLAGHTSLPMILVEDDVLIEPNRVYLVAPSRQTNVLGGFLRVAKADMPQNARLLIDVFFRSLAIDLGERAIGIVLPGMETDGELGLRAIAENGGLTFAQARQGEDGVIPNDSTGGKGVADLLATPPALIQRLLNYSHRLKLEEAKEASMIAPSPSGKATMRILDKLAQQTGHDFNGYKENTISRRISRRMAVHQIASFDDYAAFLDDRPAEIDALFRELLIGVTSFFRDAEAFACLEEKVIAPMFTNHRDSEQPIRVWIPGCSGGEEAYSLAMVLFDHAQRHRRATNFQIFATDIDPNAIERARRGRYPTSIATEISGDRMQKYFVRDGEEPFVVINRRIRDVVVFAAQNILRDPPFSRLDLICCRNFMIYFDLDVQQRLLAMMHHSLNPGGYLFLGNSDTLNSTQRLFRQVDQQWKIYQRNELGTDKRAFGAIQNRWSDLKTSPNAQSVAPDRAPNLLELTEQLLLAKHTPTAIVVNARGDMHYVHGRTDRFLEQMTGDVSTNILKVAREGLRLPIAKALYDVSLDRGDVEVDRIVLRQDDEIYVVNLSISRINNPAAARDMFLITLAETNVGPTSRAVNFKTPEELWNHVQRLENELDYTREHLQATITRYEAANEHLAHANGDLRSSNEKLHRANEELQTSKEELQSVNEELCVVNDELRQKLTETVRANNDLKNLLDNSEIRMIFLDLQLCIRRFTRGATEIVRLVDSDIGRPLDHFAHRLGYDKLHDDIREVLATLEPKALELQTLEKQWYLVRILPYRTMDEEVDGIVLTFTDVTLLKEANEKLEFLFDVLPVGISIIDRERTSFKHNGAFLRMSDLSLEDVAQRANLRRSYYRPDGTERPWDEFAASRVLAGEKAVLNIESGFRRANGEMTWLDVSAVACPIKDWSVIVVTADVTARRNAENALKNSEEKFSQIFHHAPLLIALIDIETMTLVDCNQRFLDVSGYARHEVIGTRTKALGWMPEEAGLKFLDTMSKHGFICNEEVVCRTKDGRGVECLYNGFILEINGKRQVVSMIQDVSELNRSEKIKSILRKEKETVLRELAHRTKNNMFVIRSMLNLHAMHTQNEEVHRLFTDVENKILAMALVHQKLYQSNNLSRVDLGQYLQELVPALLSSLAFAPNRIAFEVNAESISALIDTVIPCGLVVTELISNSFKYAFPDERKGKISVHLYRKSPETIHLYVADDGIGVNPNFDFRGQTTLGLQTVFMIVEHQLKGTIKFGSSEHGLTCDIEFADTLHSERV